MMALRFSPILYIVIGLMFDTTSGFRLGSYRSNLLQRFGPGFKIMMQVADPYLEIITKLTDQQRKELWKNVSTLEKTAVDKLAVGADDEIIDAYKLLAESTALKSSDPFIELCSLYSKAVERDDKEECTRLLKAMSECGAPPHLAAIVGKLKDPPSQNAGSELMSPVEGGPLATTLIGIPEEVDPGSTFSDTVTEKIRVKVNSFFDGDKSDPANGKFMFWYKVAIFNEGSEPVQIVARMWEIEKCKGEKEVVRGAGIMSTQPIIPPGEMFTYQSVCPLKVFPPKGKRVLGSMSGAYTMCKGNMGQTNFTVKVSKFNLILPETDDSDME